MLILVYPIGVVLFLIIMREHLADPAIRQPFGQFYNGVDLKRGFWSLMYYPIVLMRRLVFVVLPYLVWRYPWN